jgi:tagaturonate epimerase
MQHAGAGLAPIFAQQSIREMTRTRRTPHEVIEAAEAGIRRNWNAASGADADHLKTCDDVTLTSAAGFTLFTIDPSDFVDQYADDYDEPILRDKFEQVRSSIAWRNSYINHSVPLPNGRSFTIDEQAVMRCAVKYGPAIEHSITMCTHVREVSESANRPFELELSIDETRQPTSLAEHFIIADQHRRAGVKLVSIAPKFPGDFEKGVEYKGDLERFQQAMTDHAMIAREMGPYKVSLHSGSDKLSLYPILARATNGCFHVKTSGTSFLEALRVVARYDESLFRRIIDLARRHFERDKATYHTTANLDRLPTADKDSSANQLEIAYLDRWSDVRPGHGFTQPGRQVLHCTFGTILSNAEIGTELRHLLQAQIDTYTEFLAVHFEKHLRALAAGL